MAAVAAETIVGCILAGGRSVRMKQDKALAMLGRHTLLDRAAARLRPQVGRLIVNANDPSPVHEATGLPVVRDTLPGHAGPLAGILAALLHAETVGGATHVATAAVDAPFFPVDLVSRLVRGLGDPTGVALASSGGRLHPVFGLWPVSLRAPLDTWLRSTEDFSVRAFTTRCAPDIVDFPFVQVDPFFNVNTPEDLAMAARIARRDA